LRDARRRDALARTARQLVVDHYDWSVAAEALDAALTQCATRRRNGQRSGARRRRADGNRASRQDT
jgi:hypothetical protein